jgi:hypothetical protein
MKYHFKYFLFIFLFICFSTSCFAEENKSEEKYGKYHIVAAIDPYALVEAVENNIKNGFEPAGGVASGNFNGKTIFLQALVCKKSLGKCKK